VSRLTDELRALKDQGVPRDTAWIIATAHTGFQYRTLHACYVDAGKPCMILRDVDEGGCEVRGRSRRAA